MAYIESNPFNIFRNNKANERQPDFGGTILIPGELLQRMVDDFKQSDDKFARVNSHLGKHQKHTKRRTS